MARKSGPEVGTTAGRIRGTYDDGVAVFRGVPYAQPPVGDLRWRPPQPPTSWDGVRPAVKNGPIAIQRAALYDVFIDTVIDGMGFRKPKAAALKTLAKRMPRPKESEDCLYLTVRSPQLGSAAKLPVMVWIHGGDHQDGSGSDVFYASNALTNNGVVTVSFNYRLGLMGYFAHPELRSESPNGVAGNYGTLDQIAALRWVQDNIAEFGGDPENVTIFGESAGGESVMHMMTSPYAQDLFSRAIAQSPANSGQLIHLDRPFLDYDSALDNSAAFAHAIGIQGPDQLSRLREADVESLYGLVRSAPVLGDHFPAIDGDVIPQSPLAAFQAGQQAPVPLMIGSNAQEATVLYPALQAPMVEYRHRPSPPDRLPPEMAEAFGDDIEPLCELYPGLAHADRDAETEFMGDHMFGAPAYWYARHHSDAGNDTYLYQFTRQPPSPRATAGAFHAAELTFVHGTKAPILPVGPGDDVLGQQVRGYWTGFAASGDPNGWLRGAGSPAEKWPKLDPTAPSWLVLDHQITPQPVDRTARYELLNARTARVLAEAAAPASE